MHVHHALVTEEVVSPYTLKQSTACEDMTRHLGESVQDVEVKRGELDDVFVPDDDRATGGVDQQSLERRMTSSVAAASPDTVERRRIARTRKASSRALNGLLT
ncbi:Uncharacterised protein [Actinomadura madurae]|nr:Uncharacterised protein [Actinomadura madurae]